MFDYDRWLESPYTDAWECDTDDCAVCTFECKECDGKGSIQDPELRINIAEKCEACDGEGTYVEQQSKSEHNDYHEPDGRDDD